MIAICFTLHRCRFFLMVLVDVHQMTGDREKKYSQVYFEKDADGRPSEDGVFAVEDAKKVRARTASVVLRCTAVAVGTHGP